MLNIFQIKLRDLKEGLILLNPWLYFVAILAENSLIFRISKIKYLVILILSLITLISLLHTKNFKVILEFFATSVFILLINSNQFVSNKRITLLSKLIRGYIFTGSIIGLIFWYLTQARVGLFGGEPNFSSFTYFLFTIFLIQTNRVKLLDFFPLLILLLITSSRTLLLFVFLTMLFYFIRKKRAILISIALLFFLVNFFAQEIFILFEYIPIFEKTGYVDNYSRLTTVQDSSSIERIELMSTYFDYFRNNIGDIFFGAKNSGIFTFQVKMPHNSFIQKVFDYGIFFTGINIALLLYSLPVWIALLVLLFGFFLHNIFSLPIFIFLSIYVGKNFNNNASL